MENFVLHTVIIILIVLFFSAFFSGMEIAFLSSNKLKLEIDKKQSSLFRRIADLFTTRPGEYITTILIGNNIALVIFSLQMSALLGYLFSGTTQGGSVLMDTLLSTVVIIFFAEYLPKSIVRGSPNAYFKNFSFIVYIFYLLFYPLSKLSTWLSENILRLFGIRVDSRSNEPVFNKVDLASLVYEDRETSVLAAEKDKGIKIFRNALDFSDIRVRDCMVRRIDIDAIDVEASIDELKTMFVESYYSRIPVFEGNIDHIIGYVTNKSLFENPKTIREALLKIDYVPETMAAQKLLANLIKTKQSISVVLDEFGVTAGMVTLEDILEEIFGEIEDEYDTESLVEKKVSETEYVFSGRLEVEDLNEKYGIHIPESEEYDTLAGFIIFYNEGFPKQGEIILTDQFRIHILKMSPSKIELVKLILQK